MTYAYEAERERANLTPRQMQLIRLAADGMSNYAIARQLHIAEGTVHNHFYDAYHRLGARNRAHAAAICWQRRLIR
jgi:DNA-binding NarL/FixJ family response regulator